MRRSEKKRQRLASKRINRGWDLWEDHDEGKLKEAEKFRELVDLVYRHTTTGDSGQMCGKEWHGWVCTRDEKHKGPHAAHGGPPYAMWGKYTEAEWETVVVATRLGVAVEI